MRGFEKGCYFIALKDHSCGSRLILRSAKRLAKGEGATGGVREVGRREAAERKREKGLRKKPSARAVYAAARRLQENGNCTDVLEILARSPKNPLVPSGSIHIPVFMGIPGVVPRAAAFIIHFISLN